MIASLPHSDSRAFVPLRYQSQLDIRNDEDGVGIRTDLGILSNIPDPLSNLSLRAFYLLDIV